MLSLDVDYYCLHSDGINWLAHVAVYHISYDKPQVVEFKWMTVYRCSPC